MCGIIGYVGNKYSVPVLIDGLKRLEYRGYDSAGIAYYNNEELVTVKEVGKIVNLEGLIDKVEGASIGIGHTRWATHGQVTRANAHPHGDCDNNFIIVHNGIIENYKKLKSYLVTRGHTFNSDTDTEVIAHLIEDNYTNNLEKAVRDTLKKLVGTYGLIVFSIYEPKKLVVARYGSPLIIGKGDGEHFIASDVAGILRYTSDVIYLEDGEIVTVTKDSFSIKNMANEAISKNLNKVSWQLEDISKNGYPTFMLKEIYEQSQSITNAIRGRTNLVEGTSVLSVFRGMGKKLRRINRVIITAMGTSYHAGKIGEYLIEEFSRIPVEVEYAAELRYRGPIIDSRTLVIAISQSGETADTLGALREVKLKGATVLAICNVVGSSIARESHGGVFIHAGPEIGVASTKAFTSQVIILALVALYIGRLRYLSLEAGKRIAKEIEGLPSLVDKVLQTSASCETIAQQFLSCNNALYIGRGYNYPVALEGALKLKEISYIHAEGYNAAEMKHGPIALIDENMPVFVIALNGFLYDKIINTIEEVKARKGIVIAIATEGNYEVKKYVDYVIYIPSVPIYLSPILSVIPLQLIAYHIAVLKGCNVDQPRNLAKSVTVE